MQHQLVPRCVLWQFSEIPSYWLSHVSIRRSLAFLSAEKHYLANKWHLRLLDVFEPLGVLNSTYVVRGVKYFCTDLFQSIQKIPEDFLLWTRQDSTISLYQHYLTKSKKRERVLRLRNVLRRRQNTVLVSLAPNGGIGIRTLDPLIKSQML